jgi:cytoskeletal protein RodZ
VFKASTKIDYLNAADKYWLGEQLNAARLLRGLDIPAAARMLDLSQAQVMAIETGSQGPFMHTAHYIQNVQRFAESMNTPHSIEVLNWLERIEELVQEEAAVSSQVMRINKLLRTRLANDVVVPASVKRFNRFGMASVSMALIAFGFVITLALTWEFNQSNHSVADHQVALTQTAVLVSLNSTDAVSEPLSGKIVSSNVTSSVPENTPENVLVSTQSKVLGFNFTAPCWVQVTSSDGKVTDRLYQVSEVLYLNIDQTASLVIGNVTGAKAVTESGHPIDFNAFVSGGNVARLKGQDLASLATYH